MKRLLVTTAVIGVAALAVVGGLSRTELSAGVSRETKCQATKLKAAGKYASSSLKCYAKAAKAGVPVDQTCIDKGRANFSKAFAKAENKGPCVTTGDGAAVDGVIQSAISELTGELWAGAASKCSAKKMKVIAKYVSHSLNAYSKKRRKPVDMKVLTKIGQAGDNVQTAFVKAEQRGDCQKAGDVFPLLGATDQLVGELVEQLWPTTLEGVTFTAPSDLAVDATDYASSGGVSFNNFQSQRVHGGFLPSGGMEIGMVRFPSFDITTAVERAFDPPEIEANEATTVGGFPATRITYSRDEDRGVVVYVGRPDATYKIRLSYRPGDPNEAVYLAEFQSFLNTVTFQ